MFANEYVAKRRNLCTKKIKQANKNSNVNKNELFGNLSLKNSEKDIVLSET